MLHHSLTLAIAALALLSSPSYLAAAAAQPGQSIEARLSQPYSHPSSGSSSRVPFYIKRSASSADLNKRSSSSHASHASRFPSSSSASSSSSLSGLSAAANAPAPAPVAASDAQKKVARLSTLAAAAAAGSKGGFKKAVRVKRSTPTPAKEKEKVEWYPSPERVRATLGQAVLRRRLMVRSSSAAEGDEEEAEGDEEPETADGEGAGEQGEEGDWSWMDATTDSETLDFDESRLSTAQRMEIKMRRTEPLFHRHEEASSV